MERKRKHEDGSTRRGSLRSIIHTTDYRLAHAPSPDPARPTRGVLRASRFRVRCAMLPAGIAVVWAPWHSAGPGTAVMPPARTMPHCSGVLPKLECASAWVPMDSGRLCRTAVVWWRRD